jgi:hypothetical protein
MPTATEIVTLLLKLAAENGQTFKDWTPTAIATDMCDCAKIAEDFVWVDDDFLESQFNELVEAIKVAKEPKQ